MTLRHVSLRRRAQSLGEYRHQAGHALIAEVDRNLLDQAAMAKPLHREDHAKLLPQRPSSSPSLDSSADRACVRSCRLFASSSFFASRCQHNRRLYHTIDDAPQARIGRHRQMQLLGSAAFRSSSSIGSACDIHTLAVAVYCRHDALGQCLYFSWCEATGFDPDLSLPARKPTLLGRSRCCQASRRRNRRSRDSARL